MLALDLIKGMFSRGTKAADLKKQIVQLDQEKQSLRYDQRKVEKERAAAFERTKGARLRGDMTEVMFHLHELKGQETEMKMLLRELSRINKAMLVMRHYARRLERLERNADYKQMATFIEKFRSSSAMTRLEEADLNDDMFAQILDEELSEIDREMGFGSVDAMDDGMKAMLDQVDAMIEAEREGDEGRITQLKQQLNLSSEDQAMLDELEAREKAKQEAAQEKPAELNEQSAPQGNG
jgi:hypothetical protein